MTNIFEFGRVPYEDRPPPKPFTFSEKIVILAAVVFDVFRILVMSVPKFLGVNQLFNANGKKNVSGQTVLVKYLIELRMAEHFNMHCSTIQVTCAGNGLGREIALRLAQEGCNIAVVDSNINSARKTADDVKKFNVDAKAYNVGILIFVHKTFPFSLMFKLTKKIPSTGGYFRLQKSYPATKTYYKRLGSSGYFN